MCTQSPLVNTDSIRTPARCGNRSASSTVDTPHDRRRCPCVPTRRAADPQGRRQHSPTRTRQTTLLVLHPGTTPTRLVATGWPRPFRQVLRVTLPHISVRAIPTHRGGVPRQILDPASQHRQPAQPSFRPPAGPVPRCRGAHPRWTRTRSQAPATAAAARQTRPGARTAPPGHPRRRTRQQTPRRPRHAADPRAHRSRRAADPDHRGSGAAAAPTRTRSSPNGLAKRRHQAAHLGSREDSGWDARRIRAQIRTERNRHDITVDMINVDARQDGVRRSGA